MFQVLCYERLKMASYSTVRQKPVPTPPPRLRPSAVPASLGRQQEGYGKVIHTVHLIIYRLS